MNLSLKEIRRKKVQEHIKNLTKLSKENRQN